MRSVRRLLAVLTLLVGTSLGAEALAGDRCEEHLKPSPPACAGTACKAERGRCLLAAELHKPALDFLKREAKAAPNEGRLQVLLAIAYLENDNAVWAMRTLTQRLTAAPEDCEALVWLAWAKIQLSLFDDVADLLAGERCVSSPGALSTRTLLLRALGAHHARDAEGAKADMLRALRQSEAWAGDGEALLTLSRVIDPGRLRELSWRLEIGFGFTSNALLGSPEDPEANVAAETAIFQASGWLRVVPDTGHLVRPVLELQPRATRFLSRRANLQSTLNLTGRVGLYLDWGLPRVLLAYRPDYMQLNQGDKFSSGPLWYLGAHRFEVEVEVSSLLLVFGGVGQRDSREMGRSRTEGDLGLGGYASLTDELSLLWAVTGRVHSANLDAYDLGGASALLNLQAAIPGGWWARVGVTVGTDYYADWAPAKGSEARHDVALKLGLAVRAPALNGWRIGLSYDYTTRGSTIPEYRADDHRALVKIGWIGSTELQRPAEPSEPPLGKLRWGLDGEGGEMEERLQDLLQQDESMKPSCGCAG